MPPFLKLLSIVGTAAMAWVGGGIIVHGLEAYGLGGLAQAIHGAAGAVLPAVQSGSLLPPLAAAVVWIVEAAAAGVVGLSPGGLLIPVAEHLLMPLYRRIKPASRAASASEGTA